MNHKTHSFASLNAFSKLLLDYLAEKPALKEFYGNGPQLSNFKEQIVAKKSFPVATRNVLQTVLEEQYAAIGAEMPAVNLRDENTFTVTTGHQLNIYTGPLYVIYKLVSTINLARALQKAYPAQRLYRSIGWRRKTTTLRRLITSLRLGQNTSGIRPKKAP